MRIFNHDIMTCTSDLVVGNHLYSGRVLGVSEPGDIVQLHPDLKSEFEMIIRHYQRIGLRHSQDIVWNVSLDLISETSNCQPSVFYFGDAVHGDSPIAEQFRQVDENWFRVVDWINSKNNFIALAHQLEVAVPPTLCYETKQAVDPGQAFPYPCYVKPAFSVDGMGIVRCADADQLSLILRNLDANISFQIQAEVKASTFLNLQYQVTENGVERLAASQQILNGCSHCGNRYPSAHQPWQVVEPMAVWMASQGMKEIFAFDLAVVESENGTSYPAIECNPRYNGASYPTLIANKLGIDCWSSETFNTRHHSIEQINLNDIEYGPGRDSGVVIINWGPVLVGRMVILLAGTKEQQDQLRITLKERLC